MGLSNRVVQAFGVFDQAAIRAREHFSSTLLGRPFTGLPFLFEGVFDRAAPGAGAQLIKGQDHSRDGGRAIPRNLVVSADVGNNVPIGSVPAPLFKRSYPGGGGWEAINTGVAAPLDGDFIDQGYVSPGIDSVLASVNGLECKTILRVQTIGATTQWEFRWVNVTPGASDILGASNIYSSVQTFTPAAILTYYWTSLTFTDVPILEDRYNRFMLEIKNTNIGVVELAFYAHSETRANSEPDSAGTSDFRSLVP